jgi:hypothetical protein
MYETKIKTPSIGTMCDMPLELERLKFYILNLFHQNLHAKVMSS